MFFLKLRWFEMEGYELLSSTYLKSNHTVFVQLHSSNFCQELNEEYFVTNLFLNRHTYIFQL